MLVKQQRRKLEDAAESADGTSEDNAHHPPELPKDITEKKMEKLPGVTTAPAKKKTIFDELKSLHPGKDI